MSYPSKIYKFAFIEEFKKLVIKSHHYRTKTGIDTIVFKENEIKIYLSKNTVTAYAWDNIQINEIQQLKNIINRIYQRETIIRKTIMGYIIPDNFIFNEKGIIYEEIKETKDGNKVFYHHISDRWLFVTARVYSLYHHISQLEITSICPITKKTKTELANSSTLGKWHYCIEFLMDKLAVSTEESHKRFLSHFFNRFTIMNRANKNMKTKATTPAMGWNETLTEFFPYSDKLHLDYTGDTSKYLKNTVMGFYPPKNADYNGYVNLLKIATKNKDIEFIVSSACAAPLLSLIGIRSFVLNFYGKSGTLKTFASLLGMSIFAKPSKVKSSSADTKFCGQEILSKFKNLPYYFDEIKDKDDFDIYTVGNESSRHRLNKLGNILEKKTWRTIVLTTSEYCLYSDNIKAGEINRFLSLEVNCSDGLNIDIEEFARKNYKFIENNYALLGKKYVEFIIKNKDKLDNLFRKIFLAIKDEKKSKQYAYMIASSCLAMYIYRYLFFSIDDINHAIENGKYQMNKIELASELDQFKKMYESIKSFYEINQASFEINGIRPKSNFYFGKVNKGEIIFIIEPLKDYLEKKGFKWTQLKELKEKGWIEYKNKKIQNAEKYDTKRVIINLDLSLQNEYYEDIERKSIQEENVVDFPQ